jgi:type IV secretory pathway protease TraF
MNLQQLVAGDSLDFTTAVSTYPPSDGWTLVYRLVPRSSTATPITITAATATTDADQYRVQEGPSTTAAWAAGFYSWASWVEKSGARQSLDQGTLEILANPATVTAGYDNRGHARKVLDAIEAVLEQRATVDQQSYSINGRHLARTPIAELLRLRSVYRAEVAGEDAGEALNAGLGGGRKIQVRL